MRNNAVSGNKRFVAGWKGTNLVARATSGGVGSNLLAQRGAKYPRPAGDRGCCPGDAPRYWGLSLHDYFVRADTWPLNPDGELLAIVMIESRQAIKNINEILSVPGIGGALVGPHDLSLSLGVGLPESNPGAPEVEEATAAVGKVCAARKALCGTFSTTKTVDA